MCFVWISEQTAIISLYSINGLVFITETECVYCAVRTGSFQAQWLLYVPPGLTFTNSVFCPHSVFMCFVWISEQTAIISLYSINWLVFVTETECVYCAVRSESLSKIDVKFILQGLSLQRPGLGFGPIRVEFVVERHLDRFFSDFFRLPLSVSFHQCSILVFIYMLLLSERQTSELWEPSKNNAVSEIGELWVGKCVTCCSAFRGLLNLTTRCRRAVVPRFGHFTPAKDPPYLLGGHQVWYGHALAVREVSVPASNRTAVVLSTVDWARCPGQFSVNN
jgi:hypothetical protein